MMTLTLNHPEAIRIGQSCFSFETKGGRTVCFSNRKPFDCHGEATSGGGRHEGVGEPCAENA